MHVFRKDFNASTFHLQQLKAMLPTVKHINENRGPGPLKGVNIPEPTPRHQEDFSLMGSNADHLRIARCISKGFLELTSKSNSYPKT